MQQKLYQVGQHIAAFTKQTHNNLNEDWKENSHFHISMYKRPFFSVSQQRHVSKVKSAALFVKKIRSRRHDDVRGVTGHVTVTSFKLLLVVCR